MNGNVIWTPKTPLMLLLERLRRGTWWYLSQQCYLNLTCNRKFRTKMLINDSPYKHMVSLFYWPSLPRLFTWYAGLQRLELHCWSRVMRHSTGKWAKLPWLPAIEDAPLSCSFSAAEEWEGWTPALLVKGCCSYIKWATQRWVWKPFNNRQSADFRFHPDGHWRHAAKTPHAQIVMQTATIWEPVMQAG